MPNAFKQSGARDTASFNRRFHLSLVNLTIIYAAILVVILFASSSVTYSAFSSRLERRFAFFSAPAGLQKFETIQAMRQPSAELVRRDLIESLVLVNGILLALAAGASYFLARLTLDPIKRAYERQRRFISDASHEFRTPLAILQTDLENELAHPASEKTKENAQSRLEEVERMGRLVNDLLILSRQDEKNDFNHAKKSPINIQDFIKSTADRLMPLAKQHQIALNIVDPGGELNVNAEEDLLMQALNNVMKNAILYNKPGGWVDISWQKEDGKLRIEVIDSGIGIEEKDLIRVFDRFYRAEKSRSRQTGGSGLGLAIVQSSMEGLGGSVSIKSEPDKGTVVTLLMPI
jgi:signal transduction histidine kinase